MITVFLRGGLGNQMFQYATGLSLAKKNNTGLLLDTTFLNDRMPRKQFTYRNFDLDIFTLEPKFTVLSKISRTVPIPGIWLGLDLMMMGARDVFHLQKMMVEDERHGDIFHPGIFTVGKNVLLYGRWGSEKYFQDVVGNVRAAFTFKEKLTGEAAALAEKIAAGNAVSLHVRRGDYVLPKYEKLYGKTDLSYYERAVAHIAERVADPTIFVFSDDIAWCREHIKPPFKTVYIDDASRGPKAAFHVELMSLCKHHIIANSSFSWWGAWLHEKTDTIVVAPKRWNLNGDSSDAVPDRWVRV